MSDNVPVTYFNFFTMMIFRAKHELLQQKYSSDRYLSKDDFNKKATDLISTMAGAHRGTILFTGVGFDKEMAYDMSKMKFPIDVMPSDIQICIPYVSYSDARCVYGSLMKEIPEGGLFTMSESGLYKIMAYKPLEDIPVILSSMKQFHANVLKTE